MIAVLAIDGPAGSGKSTVARAVAARLGLPVLDTGAMYRSVAAEVARLGIDDSDTDAIVAVARDATIDLGDRVVINGRDVTEEIRTPAIDALVSPVARIPEVRRVLIAQQRHWAEQREGGVTEGRDMGAVVFPDAQLKIFLTASEGERARRRLGDQADLGRTSEEVERDLVRRDAADVPSTLQPVADAVVIDTTGMTLDEVVDAVSAAWTDSEERVQ